MMYLAIAFLALPVAHDKLNARLDELNARLDENALQTVNAQADDHEACLKKCVSASARTGKSPPAAW